MRSTQGAHGGSPSIDQPDYWWYTARTELLRAALGPYAGQVESTLDIGSADGPSVSWLRERTESLVSLDVDPRGLGDGGVCGSALALPFADSQFALVTAFDVIEHCFPESVALEEIYRVLAPGGRCLMAVPAYLWAWTDFDVANGHYRRYTKRRAEQALRRAGFSVDRSTYAFTTVFPGFVAERLSRKLRPSRATSVADVVEVPAVPTALQHALLAATKVDQALLRRVDLPFGSSIFVAASKD